MPASTRVFVSMAQLDKAWHLLNDHTNGTPGTETAGELCGPGTQHPGTVVLLVNGEGFRIEPDGTFDYLPD